MMLSWLPSNYPPHNRLQPWWPQPLYILWFHWLPSLQTCLLDRLSSRLGRQCPLDCSAYHCTSTWAASFVCRKSRELSPRWMSQTAILAWCNFNQGWTVYLCAHRACPEVWASYWLERKTLWQAILWVGTGPGLQLCARVCGCILSHSATQSAPSLLMSNELIVVKIVSYCWLQQ